MLASALSLFLLATSTFAAESLQHRSPAESDVIARVGEPQSNGGESRIQTRSRREVKKRATYTSPNFGFSSFVPVESHAFAQCGLVEAVVKGSNNLRPLTLVLLDPHKVPAAIQSGISTLKQAMALNPYAIFNLTVRDGSPNRFRLPVADRGYFDSYIYFPNGTGKHSGRVRRATTPLSGAPRCIVSCKAGTYSKANVCVTCRSTFGANVATCTSAGVKTCASGHVVKSGRCVLATTTTSAPATSTPSPSSSVQTLALNEHNRFRALHGANPLIWDTKLAAAAQTWADKCVFKHSQGAVGPYGENLAAMAGRQTATIVDGLKMWEDEASQYDPANPVYSHFTQVCWKSTTKLGCAEANCPAGSLFDASYPYQKFWVCEYSDTVGNFGDADNYRKNVQP